MSTENTPADIVQTSAYTTASRRVRAASGRHLTLGELFEAVSLLFAEGYQAQDVTQVSEVSVYAQLPPLTPHAIRDLIARGAGQEDEVSRALSERVRVADDAHDAPVHPGRVVKRFGDVDLVLSPGGAVTWVEPRAYDHEAEHNAREAELDETPDGGR